jgi:hypothetical protein
MMMAPINGNKFRNVYKCMCIRVCMYICVCMYIYIVSTGLIDNDEYVSLYSTYVCMHIDLLLHLDEHMYT